MALKKVKLGDLLELCDERNSDLKYDLSDVRKHIVETERIKEFGVV